FTGELGYEIYTAPEFQMHVLERLRAAGRTHGLSLCGMRALNALRLEKGYGSWGREFSVDYTPAEAVSGASCGWTRASSSDGQPPNASWQSSRRGD
ncbi:MAG: aminomethyl transferase family protein, partial [Phyllobacteriaceae bacterium]|nr:aminomethyl transferase family protein [Phyllobacteriaceae bacterium]